MTLAQVVYHLTNDTDFADQLYSNPEKTLANRGWKLSTEELNFLLTAQSRKDQTKVRLTSLADEKAAAWRGSQTPNIVSLADEKAAAWRGSHELGIVSLADEKAAAWRG